MMTAGFAYFGWLFVSPINLLFGLEWGTFPTIIPLVIDTIVYVPLIYYTVRRWLRTMTKRKGGPAAGIDTVEPGTAIPEPGDEWGRATRPYRAKIKTKVLGSKSEIREAPIGIDSGFFVKLPDLDTGEKLFEPEELRSKAMIRARVSSGGWISKRVRSRGVGSLKSTESSQHGRPIRSRKPRGEQGSLDLPATVMAALRRSGRKTQTDQIKIHPEDIRECVFSGRTPLTIILVIDVSMSMKGSIREIRNLLDRIERETRGSKDRTGIIAFKDSGAIEVQAPTTNWNKIYRALAKLRISGLTPLAEALKKAHETIKRERMRNADIEPLVIVISDFAPNIPLAQSVGPGHVQFTPVKDIVKTSRLLRKAKIRMVTVNVAPEQRKWSIFLKRPYHEALELSAMLRMKKDGYTSLVETILAVPEFRQTFGAFLIALAGGGRAFHAKEIMGESSILSIFLESSRSRAHLRVEDLKKAEAYLR
ncbi:MAG: vWA domain-containing protein [Candidatus Thorarchaeota archaeon]|jgi:Mg-chelatase subunit ChlD